MPALAHDPTSCTLPRLHGSKSAKAPVGHVLDFFIGGEARKRLLVEIVVVPDEVVPTQRMVARQR